MKDLYLIGGGGHCKACIDVIESTGKYNIKGIFDKKENIGKEVLGYKIIGTDDDISKFLNSGSYFLITVGQIKSPKLRMKLFKLNLKFATVVSNRSYVSSHSRVGEGTIIMHDVVIGPNVVIGKNNIINNKALVEHDSKIGDHCHISTGAIVNGSCVVGDGVFIGSNSVLKNDVRVPSESIISYGTKYE